MRIENPPAQVREHVDQDALKRQAESAYKAVLQADQDAAEMKKTLGEILIKLKKQVGLGKWKEWCASNLSFHYRTARRCMRIAENWTAIQEKVTGLSPGTPKHQDHSYLTGGAALRLISKPKGRRGKAKLPKVPEELKKYETHVRSLNREFGIKAPPSAVLGLLIRLGIPEAQLKEALKGVQDEGEQAKPVQEAQEQPKAKLRKRRGKGEASS